MIQATKTSWSEMLLAEGLRRGDAWKKVTTLLMEKDIYMYIEDDQSYTERSHKTPLAGRMQSDA